MVEEIKVPMKDLKVFEIKCHVIPIQALPAGTKAPKLLTEFEKLNMKSIEDLGRLKGRIAGVMMPKDVG
jgi:hypothetical protein